MVSPGFSLPITEAGLYVKKTGKDVPFLVSYVDDSIVDGADLLIKETKQQLSKKLDITDKGLSHYSLALSGKRGIEFSLVKISMLDNS